MDKKPSLIDARIDRRRFLLAAGALGVGAVAGASLQSAYKVVKLGRSRQQVEQTVVRMGTYVTIIAVHESRHAAEQAIGNAIAEMDRHVAVLSRHDGASPLSILNRDGNLSAAPGELLDVVRHAQWIHNTTRGAFDITVKPVVDLVADTFASGGHAPSDAALADALACVGSDRLEVHGRDLRLAAPGMGVTLDGIAKGFIVDRVSDSLSRDGVAHHLVNAGGDIRVRGTRASGKPWRIAIEDPEKKGRYRGVVELASGAVATSGNYEIYYDRERVHHHIVDPATGVSPVAATSVSVVAGSAMLSDALATAVFVLGPEHGPAVVDTLGGPACLVIDPRGGQFRSRGWDALTGGSNARVG
ncbi:MAG TPA: FAD:protein FMN transferase [Candidatus Krumholzibacteria bacterium]|nr:FAD:protein FMN transferase [Candidatus Krumholzibacteria bacterium]